jgi:hypothetical protein
MKEPCWEGMAGWTASGCLSFSSDPTPAAPGRSPDSFNAAGLRYRGCRGRKFPLRRMGRRNAHKPVAGFELSGMVLRWLQTGALGQQQPQGGLAVILAHGGLEVGGRQMCRMGLMRTPLHEEAVADAPEQTGHKHGVRVANPATIIVVGNVQTLVQAVFDAAETRPVQLQPFLGIEPFGGSAGDEANVFILATLGLAQ